MLKWLAEHGALLSAASTLAVAVFTLVLALATALLWWSTNALVKDARLNSERELRAYIFIKGGGVLLLENAAKIQASVDLENFGHTPGYEFETWTGIAVGSPKEPPFEHLGQPRQKSIIAPRAMLNAPSQRLPIAAEDLSAIRQGQKVIFVWGYARYRDSFSRRREFIFRQMISGADQTLFNDRGQAAGPGWGLNPHPDGYLERTF